MHLKLYLSGEIHTGWRDEIIQGIEQADVMVKFGEQYRQWNAAFDTGLTNIRRCNA